MHLSISASKRPIINLVGEKSQSVSQRLSLPSNQTLIYPVKGNQQASQLLSQLNKKVSPLNVNQLVI